MNKTSKQSPRFAGVNHDDACIQISFLNGNISKPVFSFASLDIHCDEGYKEDCDDVYVLALKSLKNLVDDEIQTHNNHLNTKDIGSWFIYE